MSQFLAFVDREKVRYRTNNIIITMGGDFTYQDATMWYSNLDKLIKNVNLKAAKDNLKIKLFYSTPDCYLKAVKDANPTLPTKDDDFFPYASDPHSYWTGYFTSRPTTKYFEREGNDYLQAAKQLHVVADLPESTLLFLDQLKSAMGVMQHHDAITGTEKQHVTFDYERMLDQAVEDVIRIPRMGINKMMKSDSTESVSLSMTRCRLNESSCELTETSYNFIVTLYNPLGWKLDAAPVRIPVVDGKYAVIAPNGDEIDAQLVKISEHVKSIPTRDSRATHELVFIALNVKPLGYKSFYVEKVDSKRSKRQATNRNYNFNSNVNEYWQNIKEQPNTETKIQEKQGNIYQNQQPLKAYPPSFAYEISNSKIKPRIQGSENKYNSRPNFGVLRDKDGDDYSFLEKLKDEDASYDIEPNMRNNRARASMKPMNLNNDEMRMLSDQPENSVVDKYNDDMFLENEHIKLRVNNTTGQITDKIINQNESPCSIELLYYTGWYGNNSKAEWRSSGAYIFRPQETKPVSFSDNFTSNVTNGKVVDEIAYKFTDFATGNIRIYKNAHLNYIEHDWVIGPIPVHDHVGKEFIVKYGSHIQNNGEFYTDSNGRQDLKRRLNYRPQWNLDVHEPVAGNYYPVTSKIFIEDDESRFTVLTDRSEGGSSLKEGDIELMLHRRLLHDDAFGVGEPLNETQNGKGLVVKGKHRLLFTDLKDKNKIKDDKKKAIEMHLQPLVLLSDASELDLERWLTLKNCEGALKDSLPLGLHLLTLEPWDEGQMLIRFENYLQKKDNPTELEVDLNNLFNNLNILAISETTLAANQPVNKEKWFWNTEDFYYRSSHLANKVVEDLKIRVKPKEIRTFIVDYEFEK